MNQRRMFCTASLGMLGLISLCAAAHAAPQGKQPKGDAPAVAHGQPPAPEHGKDKGMPGERSGHEGRGPRGESSAPPGPPPGASGGPGMPPGPMGSGSAGPDRPRPPEGGDASERKERRRHQLDELRGRWGKEALKKPACQEELKNHAWRMARLKRMRELAAEKKNDKQLAKIDELEKKELSRHEKAMAREQGGAPPSASGAPIPSVGAPGAVQGGKQ